jgi:hypothetical protein
MLVLVKIGVFMLVVTCLTCLFISFHNIAHGYLLVLVMVSLQGFTLVFASLGIMVVYNYLNTCMYIL